jgi:hypothetical protein
LKPKIKWVPTGGVVQDAVAKGESEIASAAGLPLVTGGCAAVRDREDLSGALIAVRRCY